jgi:hypothetical protein
MPGYREDATMKFNSAMQREWEATNEIEAILTRQIATAPVMSAKRLLCAEMILVCKFYRDLINPKDKPAPEYDGHF